MLARNATPTPTNLQWEPLPPIGRRRRAARACRMCKARKVRCDGQIRKNGCTNCQLDGHVCVVDERRTKKQAITKNNSASRPGGTAQPEEMNVPAPPHLQLDDLDIYAHSENSNSDSSHGENANGNRSEFPFQPVKDVMAETVDDFVWEIPGLDYLGHLPLNVEDTIMIPSNLSHEALSMQIAAVDTPPCVVDPGNRSHLSPKEVDFLESENAFDLPNPPELDQFLRAFFLIVHPNLPVADEATFWRAYKDQDQFSQFSLFVVNAMLCVSSAHVHSDVISKAGFESHREAGATFYRRAKLLYDFGIEGDQVLIANGALLLSCFTTSDKSPQIVRNTSWLGIAVEIARSAKTKQHFKRFGSLENQKLASVKLWWCCFIRDRFLSLGTRRYFKSHEIPDLPSLKTDIFEGDDISDNVYDRESSRRVAQLFIIQCKLAMALTGVTSEVCPPGFLPAGEQEAQESLERIERFKASLEQWFEESVVLFPTPSALTFSERNLVPSVNAMYIHYYNARMALAHRQILLLHSGYKLQIEEAEVLQQCLRDVEDCVSSITELIKELVLMGLIGHLSFGVMLHSAFPYILHQLDLKLSSTIGQRAQRDGRLKVFTQLMDQMRTSYSGSDGADNVIQFLKDQIESEASLLNLISPVSGNEEDRSRSTESNTSNEMSSGRRLPTKPSVGWQDVLLHRRRFYFQLVLSHEVSLSQGFTARTDDILPLLQVFKFDDDGTRQEESNSS